MDHVAAFSAFTFSMTLRISSKLHLKVIRLFDTTSGNCRKRQRRASGESILDKVQAERLQIQSLQNVLLVFRRYRFIMRINPIAANEEESLLTDFQDTQ
jgi:hypothetical protein